MTELLAYVFVILAALAAVLAVLPLTILVIGICELGVRIWERLHLEVHPGYRLHHRT